MPELGDDRRRRAARAAPVLSAPVRPLLDAGLVKGMAHITGGGITENLPRMLPEGCAADDRSARVDGAAALRAARSSAAASPTDEMFRAFNMGIGLIVVVRRGRDAERVVDAAGASGRAGRASARVVVAGEPVGPLRQRDAVLTNRRRDSASSSPAAAATCSRSSTPIAEGGSTRRSPSSSRIGRRRRASRARDAGIETLCLEPARLRRPRRVRSRARRRRCARATSTSSAWPASCGWSGQPLLDAFPNRILNIHPSLLPAFPGPRRAASGAGARRSGQRRDRAPRDVGARRRPDLLQAAVPVRETRWTRCRRESSSRSTGSTRRRSGSCSRVAGRLEGRRFVPSQVS